MDNLILEFFKDWFQIVSVMWVGIMIMFIILIYEVIKLNRKK